MKENVWKLLFCPTVALLKSLSEGLLKMCCKLSLLCCCFCLLSLLGFCATFPSNSPCSFLLGCQDCEIWRCCTAVYAPGFVELGQFFGLLSLLRLVMKLSCLYAVECVGEAARLSAEWELGDCPFSTQEGPRVFGPETSLPGWEFIGLASSDISPGLFRMGGGRIGKRQRIYLLSSKSLAWVGLSCKCWPVSHSDGFCHFLLGLFYFWATPGSAYSWFCA